MTDFGLSDYFVPAMKGRILSVLPEAMIVDATHEIVKYSVLDASLTLEGYWSCFPVGTVHLCVVDPGVGTDRAILVAEYMGHFFVAPDNGLLTCILEQAVRYPDNGPLRAWILKDENRYVKDPSPSFHGRDIFAPLAAEVASTGDPGGFLHLWDPVYLKRVSIPDAVSIENLITGLVIHVDSFGNLITNIRRSHFLQAHFPAPDHSAEDGDSADGITVSELFPYRIIANEVIFFPCRTFAMAQVKAEPLAMIGSSGRLELCMLEGCAAELEGFGIGTTVRIEVSGNR
jgi:hypothetical protein